MTMMMVMMMMMMLAARMPEAATRPLSENMICLVTSGIPVSEQYRGIKSDNIIYRISLLK